VSRPCEPDAYEDRGKVTDDWWFFAIAAVAVTAFGLALALSGTITWVNFTVQTVLLTLALGIVRRRRGR